jgi:hypothetical protein
LGSLAEKDACTPKEQEAESMNATNTKARLCLHGKTSTS